MLNLLLVGSGGFIGSALRYLVGLGAQHLARHSAFPYGTLAVNVLGCLLIGFLAGLAQQRDLFNASARLFVFTGMLGGFTTFSTFSYESMVLIQEGAFGRALISIGANLFLCLGLCYLGMLSARW